jgi:hypothetical protein
MRLLIVLLLMLPLTAFAGFSESMERFGQSVERTAEEADASLNKAARNTGDFLDETTGKIEPGMNKAASKTEGWFERMGAKLNEFFSFDD